MRNIDYGALEPFEIASIRPPTENGSLSFRVTRNCYWNKCKYCPVYKTGAGFSRRSLEEVKADIANAKELDNILFDMFDSINYKIDNSNVEIIDLIIDDIMKVAVSKY